MLFNTIALSAWFQNPGPLPLIWLCIFLPMTCVGLGKPFVPKYWKITSQFVFLMMVSSFCLVTQNDDTKTNTTFETISLRFLHISFCQQHSIPEHSKREALKLLCLSQSLDSMLLKSFLILTKSRTVLWSELSWQAQTPPAILLCQHGHLHRLANPTAWLAKSVHADLSGTAILVL